MKSLTEIILQGEKFYRFNWRKLIVPFALGLILSLLGSEAIVIVNGLGLLPLQLIIIIGLQLALTFFAVCVYLPVEEMLKGGKIPAWWDNLKGKALAAVKILSFYAVVILLLGIIALFLLAFFILPTPENMSLVLLVTGIIGLVIFFFTQFFAFELYLRKMSIRNAVLASVPLVRKNLWPVFLLSLFWTLIQFCLMLVGNGAYFYFQNNLAVAAFIGLLATLVMELLISPVRLIANIMLWKELKVEETVAPEKFGEKKTEAKGRNSFKTKRR